MNIFIKLFICKQSICDATILYTVWVHIVKMYSNICFKLYYDVVSALVVFHWEGQFIIACKFFFTRMLGNNSINIILRFIFFLFCVFFCCIKNNNKFLFKIAFLVWKCFIFIFIIKNEFLLLWFFCSTGAFINMSVV